LRKEFHIPKLFEKDEVKMVYSHIDRIITAGFMPVEQELKLEAGKELAFSRMESVIPLISLSLQKHRQHDGEHRRIWRDRQYSSLPTPQIL